MGVYERSDSPFWWIYLEGLQQKVNTHILVGKTATQRKDSRALADELYHQQMLQLAADQHRLTGPISRTRTLSQQIKWHLENVTVHHAGAEREEEILDILKAGMGPLPLMAIDRTRVQEWMRKRIAENVTPSTVNREIDVLKSVLRDAVPTYLRSSPLVGMKRLRSGAKPHRRLLTPGEETKLLRALEPDDRAIVIMGLDTLCRLSDILDLRRQDDKGAVLYIGDTKNNQPYEVPVSVRLRKALDKLPLDGPYYFQRRRVAKTARDRRAAIRLLLRRTCKELNIPYGRKHGGITFHWATRRTGATRMIQRGVDVRTVQEIGNWKHPAMLLQIYAESNADARQKAVELVSQKQRQRAPKKKTA